MHIYFIFLQKSICTCMLMYTFEVSAYTAYVIRECNWHVQVVLIINECTFNFVRVPVCGVPVPRSPSRPARTDRHEGSVGVVCVCMCVRVRACLRACARACVHVGGKHAQQPPYRASSRNAAVSCGAVLRRAPDGIRGRTALKHGFYDYWPIPRLSKRERACAVSGYIILCKYVYS